MAEITANKIPVKKQDAYSHQALNMTKPRALSKLSPVWLKVRVEKNSINNCPSSKPKIPPIIRAGITPIMAFFHKFQTFLLYHSVALSASD